MAKEIADGTIPDPSIPTDPETGIPLDQIADMDLGSDEMEPDLESEAGATKAPEIPKGGEI